MHNLSRLVPLHHITTPFQPPSTWHFVMSHFLDIATTTSSSTPLQLKLQACEIVSEVIMALVSFATNDGKPKQFDDWLQQVLIMPLEKLIHFKVTTPPHLQFFLFHIHCLFDSSMLPVHHKCLFSRVCIIFLHVLIFVSYFYLNQHF